MKTLNNDHYTSRVTYSKEDKEYVGLCVEFPGLSWLDRTPEVSLKGIRGVAAKVVGNMGKSNESIPEPISERRYSGKFMVRDVEKLADIPRAGAAVQI